MLRHFAKAFNTRVKDNHAVLPDEIGKGFMRCMVLPNGLQILVSDYKTSQDVLFQRKKSNKDFFVLRFDEIVMPAADEQKAKFPETASSTQSSVFLMNTKFDGLFLSSQGTHIKSIVVLFSREWLEAFFGYEKNGELIKKFLSLKMSAFNYEPLDNEYKRIMTEVIENHEDRVFESLIVQNRIMLLLERFFVRIYKKMSSSSFDAKVSSDDLGRLIAVEAELMKDFSIAPPGIVKLARMAAMSPSKLKNSFREVYGLPIYQYFQKHRMNKAKAMLLSRKYSVKEVGMEVGYSNLSNFAKAFKKSFDQLPSDVLTSKN